MKQTFRSNIFRSEQKELTAFNHMCHVVVRTKSPVRDKDKRSSIIGQRMSVNDITKCAELVFFTNGLNNAIRIEIRIQVIGYNGMRTVATISGVPLGGIVFRRRKMIKNWAKSSTRAEMCGVLSLLMRSWSWFRTDFNLRNPRMQRSFAGSRSRRI